MMSPAKRVALVEKYRHTGQLTRAELDAIDSVEVLKELVRVSIQREQILDERHRRAMAALDAHDEDMWIADDDARWTNG